MGKTVPLRHCLPLREELGLHVVSNAAGIEISILPNGCLYSIEHRFDNSRTLINQVLGSPVGGCVWKILARRGPSGPPIELAGSRARGLVGSGPDRFIWQGESDGLFHSVTLWLHPLEPVWFWVVELQNNHSAVQELDARLVQDIGLSDPSTVLANGAYISHYIDHTVCKHRRFGEVVLSRQNLGQSGRHPWVAHGILEGASRFATDALQIFGPAFRGSDPSACLGSELPSIQLQHESSCMAVQSAAIALAPGQRIALHFFGLYDPDHINASSEADLVRLDMVESAMHEFCFSGARLSAPCRSLFQHADVLTGKSVGMEFVACRYPERLHEERKDGLLLSFFVPDGEINRHVVLGAKELQMQRRHGLILLGGHSVLPEETALSATCWMHGVFATQITFGNTTLHKILSVSHDAYNIDRTGGLRILVDLGDGWRLLGVPSVFEMGLSDCKWIYRFEDAEISIRAIVSADDTAIQWSIETSGPPLRFLVCGQLVMGEHEFRHPARVEFDLDEKRVTLRPDLDGLWGRHYPQTVLHFITSTRELIDSIGTGAILFDGPAPRGADAFIVFTSGPTSKLSFALVGSLTDPEHAAGLAEAFGRGITDAKLLQGGAAHWSKYSSRRCFAQLGSVPTELNTIFPWLVQNALVHLCAPRGLEQFSAAWGTRDICQGPVELLLALGHYESVREILRIVFSQQCENSGNWPQWFMLEPYQHIREPASHGDIIVWPLKALCDYLEQTGDLSFLAELIPWTRQDCSATVYRDTVIDHVNKLLEGIRQRFVPGTNLARYGMGDWNDSLEPADPKMRDWMVSSWTVALLYQQLRRYANVLKPSDGALLDLAGQLRQDFTDHLMPDGIVAGYVLFDPDRGQREWLLHPRDTRTGVRYSLIAMTRAIVSGLFDAEQTRQHLGIIRDHLVFPDGAHLMDKPIAYNGGLELNFKRAESSAFFGREIGLMYVHAHLRYCEALDALGETQAFAAGLRGVNPVNVTEDLPHASLRQRNVYFTSSDAAFHNRKEASAEWIRVRTGTIPVDGGWRVYSSGPGIFVRLALQHYGRARVS